MDVRLPRLGEGADSGTVASIFVKEGDRLAKDQAILELESEKAVATIPSPADGTVGKIHVKEGDVVKVGQMLLTLSEEGTATPPVPQKKIIDVTVGDDEEELASRGSAPPFPGEQLPAAERASSENEYLQEAGIPPAAAPSVRKMARELGIDLRRVKGSERGGRIVPADLRRYIQRLQQQALQPKPAQPPTALQTARTKAGSPDFEQWGPVDRAKMSALRRTISARMAESWSAVPHVTQFDQADVTDLLNLKKKYEKEYQSKGGHLTLTVLVLKALIPVLKTHAMFNASIDEAAGEIVFKKYYHIGIAVDTEQGLIVPVLRDVDKKSPLELSRELSQLAERTRQRKVALEEMQGGTFTISNQGGIGSGHFTPIVNFPQVAILGLGRSVASPVVVGNKVEQRAMLPVSLSYDHRIIDGANAARFMVDFVRALETITEAEVNPGF